MKKLTAVLAVFFLGSLGSLIHLASYRAGRCDYAKAKYDQATEDILKQQDDFCFTIRARVGEEDPVLADKACKKWLNEKVKPEVEAYFAEELKKDSCN